MKVGAPELTVGDAGEPQVFLEADDVSDGAVLGVAQLRLRQGAGAVLLAGGVGDVPLAVFATTPADNLKNGLSPDEAGFTRWDLVACIGATSDTVHATHKPTAHLGVNEKKPRLTPQVLEEIETILLATPWLE